MFSVVPLLPSVLPSSRILCKHVDTLYIQQSLWCQLQGILTLHTNTQRGGTWQQDVLTPGTGGDMIT